MKTVGKVDRFRSTPRSRHRGSIRSRTWNSPPGTRRNSQMRGDIGVRVQEIADLRVREQAQTWARARPGAIPPDLRYQIARLRRRGRARLWTRPTDDPRPRYRHVPRRGPPKAFDDVQAQFSTGQLITRGVAGHESSDSPRTRLWTRVDVVGVRVPFGLPTTPRAVRRFTMAMGRSCRLEIRNEPARSQRLAAHAADCL